MWHGGGIGLARWRSIAPTEMSLSGGGRSPVSRATGSGGHCQTLRVWQRPGAHFMGGEVVKSLESPGPMLDRVGEGAPAERAT